jgi:xanthine dehydrogenase accessory factor
MTNESDPTGLYRLLAEAEERHSPVWIATVIAVEGSTPVDPGMKMLIGSNGRIAGTIGGGEIERRVIDRIVAERPRMLQRWRYDLGAGRADAEKTGMICGGYQEILIEALFGGAPLYIIGGGHCGIALSGLASRSGFDVTVIDDREEWANNQKHSTAVRTICTPFRDIAGRIGFSPDAFIVIMTHGHKYDEMTLRQCIGKEYRFLGLLGSDTKVRELFDRLLSDGVNGQEIKNICAPVGLDIGSHTPEEIAVSIVAQMIAVKYGRPYR